MMEEGREKQHFEHQQEIWRNLSSTITKDQILKKSQNLKIPGPKTNNYYNFNIAISDIIILL